MNVDEIRKKIELTDEEFETNMDEIFGELSLCAKKELVPIFTLVGGQAGSGKSALVASENQSLGGNAIIIDQDELRTKFPKEKYKQIHDNCNEREEFLILKPYISRAVVALKERALNCGYNIILESALRSVSSFIDVAKELKIKGYNTKLSILAVPEVEANISMLTRYCYYLEKYGECRRNTRLDHSAVQSLRTNIQRLDDLEIFDDITISVRGKEMDLLPVQNYSKRTDTKLTPLQAYDEGVKHSFNDTIRNFEMKYEQIKKTLSKHQEIEQLEKLEMIRKAFEKEKSEER